MLTRKQYYFKTTKSYIQGFLKAFSFKEILATELFVFGAQRSGTNMLAKILDRNLWVECYHENDETAFNNYELRRSKVAGLVRDSNAQIVLFKCISDSQHASEFLSEHVNSQGIWIYRHYYDVINSFMRQFKECKKYLYYILYDRRIARWRAEKISEDNLQIIKKFYSDDLTDASAVALIWYLRNSLFFEQDLQNSKKILLVKYENLVSEPQHEIRKICHMLNIPYSNFMISFVHNQSVRKNRAPEINPEIKELNDMLMKKFDRML